MPKKTTLKDQPIPQEQATVTYQRKVEDIILDDATARLMRVVLVRGKDFSKTRFPMYTGLVMRMRQAYDRHNTDYLLSALQEYLRLASALVPGVPASLDHQQEMCTKIGELIAEHGITAMGRALLPGLW